MTAEPDALRLVPVEPTREMMDAWHRSAWPKGPDVSLLSQAGLAFCRHYAAMLAAAPVSIAAPSSPAAPAKATAATAIDELYK